MPMPTMRLLYDSTNYTYCTNRRLRVNIYIANSVFRETMPGDSGLVFPLIIPHEEKKIWPSGKNTWPAVGQERFLQGEAAAGLG